MGDSNRRSFLKSIVGGIAAYPTLGGASAGTNEESGLRECIEALLLQGRRREAFRLLDREKLGYTAHMDSLGSSLESDTFRTQDHLKQGNSRVEYVLYQLPSGNYSAAMNWFLNKDFSWTGPVDAPTPNDGAAIGWEDSQWGYVDESINAGAAFIWKVGGAGEIYNMAYPAPEITNYPFDDPANSVGAQINDSYKDGEAKYADKINGLLSVKLRKQDDRIGAVGFNYTHTWTNKAKLIGNLIGSVALSGQNASVSFDIPLGADKWEKREVLESDT